MARPVPADLEDALAAHPAARERFWSLPPEQVDEWVGWVDRARFPGARRRRIGETVRRLDARTETTETAVGATGVPVPRDTWLVWVLGLALLAGLAALALWLTVYRDTSSSRPTAVVVTAKSTVPKVTGIRRQAAEFQLEQEKLAARVVQRPAAKPRGIVAGQKPAAGATVPQGTEVTLLVSTGPPGAKLPDLAGLAAADAVKRLQALRLRSQLRQVAAGEAPGTVVAQTPKPGARARRGSVVVLDVAKGRAPVAVPAVTGQDQQQAAAALKQAGLGTRIVEVPSTQPRGVVLAQRPAAGQTAARGTQVRLNVSKGPAQTTQTQTTQTQTTQGRTETRAAAPAPTPQQPGGNDYRGMRLERAVQRIVEGRQQVIVVYVASNRPAGIVVANSAVGSRERLEVSAGPRPEPAEAVPDERGQDAATAQGDLEAAGFVVLTVDWPVSDETSDGMVVAQTPSRAPAGSTIVLYIGSYAG